MQTKPLYAALVAAAFAIPLSVNAASTDKTAATSASQTPATSQTPAASNDGGAEAMFTSMDKNNDGFISKEEAKGTPHDAAFATLDKNGDGKLSRAEHAAAPEHMNARSKGASTGISDKTAVEK